MTDSEVVQIVARLKKLESKKREAQCEIDGIRSMLHDEFAKRGISEIKAGRFVARRVTYTRDQFDTAKCKLQQPTAYELYCKPVAVTRIDIVG